jgi:hypothetical protein
MRQKRNTKGSLAGSEYFLDKRYSSRRVGSWKPLSPAKIELAITITQSATELVRLTICGLINYREWSAQQIFQVVFWWRT